MTTSLHRTWVIRSYAMILAAVTWRIHLPLLAAHYQGITLAYAIVASSCWLPNMLVARLVPRRSLRAPI